jgi:bis(5'-nucleosyl)-tetraphosphatase (symmetrical)
MRTFAIGDLQGLHSMLMRLLERIGFDPEGDHLWFCGDLVNRGPDSLEVLRFVYRLGTRATVVLGNHDLYLLRVAAHPDPAPTLDPSLRPILEAPDRDELLDWLRHRPLLHHDPALGFTLVHAGLPPFWDLEQANARAQSVEAVLRGAHWKEALPALFGNEPDAWQEGLPTAQANRFTVNALTRMRYVTSTGKLDFRHKGSPGTQPEGLYPWFEIPNRRNQDLHIVFGHWSTLGDTHAPHVYPLDGGCLWGGTLRAMRLDGESHLLEIPCPEHSPAGS